MENDEADDEHQGKGRITIIRPTGYIVLTNGAIAAVIRLTLRLICMKIEDLVYKHERLWDELVLFYIFRMTNYRP